MSEFFQGNWRATVIGRNAGFSQRVNVIAATSGAGAYDGVVGNSFVFENGQVDLEWNNNAGSSWQPSAIISSIGMSSPLIVVRFMSADDNFPDQRDGDYDDLQVKFEHLDAPFEITQRPFALERGSLVMMPDGIFDTSQGVQYMGVRIRNKWFFDWTSDFPTTGMKIGIAPTSRSALGVHGVIVLDAWTTQEQQQFGQVVDGGYVRVPDLKVGEETTIYFKVDVRNAGPSKPVVGFVAQRDAFDPNYDAPTRVVHKKIFITRSAFDKTTKELVASVPEGTLRLKLGSIKLDLKAANDAAKDLMKCLSKGDSGGPRGGSGGGSWWEDCRTRERICKERGSEMLRRMLKELLDGKDIDICRLQELLNTCCDPKSVGCCSDGGGGGGDGGGWQDGTGVDGWCRVKPIGWLPISFDYKIEPNPAYLGQFGPLPFEDPWWKVILIIIAVLLAIASVVYDYIEAGQDPKFIIGKIRRVGDANANHIDCAVCDLNGSRGVNLGQEDAQSDDVNNGSPIEGLGNIIQLDRTDNGDFGIQDAVLGNVVWKSGGRSGTTRGVVNSITFATNVNYDTEDTISGVINYVNQVHVTQIVGMEQPLSQAGDSGSVWVDMASKRPVALNFAGDLSDAGTDGIGNPIRLVVNQLNIRFNN
ncbi:hypothetical protein [Methylocystis sp. B8]|uniref:hypothetical protein n=1 Tax=Methylocystis sp. B8 TaxID=544938 RepID=UPI0010FE6F32|nr:hypothetical protein [Methylocystis sp. B8]TLG71877.1 hypothetical protein FEV16_15445 [Methylocystis sp. B8]